MNFTSVKLSNNALNFLLAQYRAIFKRAYVKGLAAAVMLTAGLAAGQAQATPSSTNPIYTTTDDSNWTIESGSAITASGSGVAGDYDNGTAEAHNDGIVSGESLVIGDSGSTINGDVTSITSGSAYAGYVSLDSGSTLDALAEGNTLTVASGGNINTSGGNIVGGWAKTNGSGVAIARDNKLVINNADGGVTLTSGGSFIGGVAAGNNGATAEGNSYIFTGESGSKTAISHNGNYGALVFVGDRANSGSKGSFEALGNSLEMSNFSAIGTETKNKTFIGGHVQALGLTSDNTIEVLRAQGNTVDLSNFSIGAATTSNALVLGNIAANYVTNTSGAVALVEANGDGETGIVLTDGEIYGATVLGGMAQNVSGGNATASNNTVTITDTNLRTSLHILPNGYVVSYSAVLGGHAESTITSGGQKIALTASNNTVNLDNSTVNSNSVTTYQVEGTIRGAELMITKYGNATNLVGTSLTADNNSVTVGEGIKLSNGLIQGVYIATDATNITSGGATLHASNNTVTVDGNWTSSTGANIATVVAKAGLLTAENNKLVINGKVEGQGALIAAVVASQQQAITGKIENPVHNLSNNSVEIGADAEVIDAKIYAAQSTKTSAHTFNNDVTIAGKVTNSDIYGGTGADSLIDVQAGSRLSFSKGTSSQSGSHSISSDVVNLAGIIDVGQYDTVQVKGFVTDGNNNAGTYNTNATTIAGTAQLYNRNTVEFFGQTTVETGAQLHALTEGASLKVNGAVGQQSIIKEDNTLGYEMVGGRGQLTIAAAQLKSYLTSGDKYTLGTSSGTDKAGTVEVTSGGVLEFSDDAIDLATLDYSTSAEAGKIKVDTTGGTSILKGDAVTISHALASNGSTANTLDFSKTEDYTKLRRLSADGVTIEANQLFLGSSRIDEDQSKDIKFAKGTAKNRIDFTVGDGTFQLASEVAGNNFMRTDDQKSELTYFTALNGTITGDVDVVSGGKLAIEYGHWTAQGDITLQTATTSGGALVVGIDNTDTDARNHIDNGTAALPDATLVLDQALTVDVGQTGTATITVDGQNSSGYTYADGESNRLGLYDEELAQSTVGDDHYVLLDLRNGLNMVGNANNKGSLDGKFKLTAQSGGVVKVMADDINSLLTQNDASTDGKSGAFINVSGKAHLQVTGDVSADFGDFGQSGDTNGIKLEADGVMSANSLSLINAGNNTGTLPDDANYITTNKIDFGSTTGTVSASEVTINDLQRVTKPEGSTSDNEYASQVTFARGTLDIGSNLSSINDTLVVGESGSTDNVAHLNFYGADIDESTSGATTVGTINVDTVSVQNGSVTVANGAWQGNAFVLGASGAMTVGSSEEDTRADLSAQKLTMTQGSSLSVLAKGSMTVNEVDFSGLSTAATREDVSHSIPNAGVLVDGTLVINGSSAEHGGVTFGAASSIDIANNGVLKFGTAATNGAILDTSSTKSFSGSGSINLVQGYTQIDNNGGELHLALGSDVVFDGDAIKALKDALFTDDSFESGVQLANGGILNIGDASFKGITGFEALTAPGTSGYTIAWNNVKDFSDIYGNDVTSNQLSQVNVNSIQQGTKVQGHWGSLTMENGVAAGAQVTIFGNTSLRNAAGNNGFFVSDASHASAKGAIIESQKDLELIGGGTIGRVTLAEGNYDAFKNLTVLEVRDGATTIAAIDAKDSANIATGTLVNLYSDTTVTGDITNIDTVEAYQGAQVTAANAKVDEVSTQNADIAIAEDLDFNQAYVFGGSVTAKNADMTSVTTGGNDGKEIAVINGGLFKVTDTLKAEGLIRVGVDTSTISEADITLDDGTVAGGTGYFEVGTLELNGARLVIDPEYDEATSVGAALKFKKGNETYTTNDAGTLVGDLHIGKNAAFGIGATLAETQAAIADFKVGSALDADKYGSILYLNGQLTVDGNDSEIALNAHDDDIRQSLLYTVSSQELNQFADLGLGKNTAIIMTDKAFADAEGNKTGTAITFDRQDAVVNGQGGEIVLAGNFDVTDKLNIFADKGNAADSTMTGVKVIGSIDVRTLNGFLFYTLSGENAGQGITLEVDKERAYQVMSEASDPVIATLIAYAPSGSQGGDSGTSDETIPASEIEAQDTLAQNSNGRSGAIVELPGEGGSSETPSEPNEPSTPGEGEGSNEPTTPTTPTATASSSFLNAVVINTHGAPAEQAARLGVYGGSAQVGLAASNSNADVLASRFGIGANAQSLNLASNGMGGTLWVAPIYKSQDSDGFAAQGLNYGVDFDLYGVALGGDYKVTNEITVGAMFNVGSGDLDGQGNTAAAGVSNDFDYFGFGLYGAYQSGALTVTADLSYTQVDNDLEGNNELGKVSASADTTAWSLGVTGQYKFSFAAVDVTPHAGLRFTALDLDDYGVNAAGHGTVANFDSDTLSVFSIPVGVTFAKSFKSETWTVTPALDLQVTGQFGDDEAEGSVSWSGTNLSTNVTSEVFDNFTYGATVGVEAQSVSGFSFGLGLGYTGSSNVDEFAAQANARFTF